MLSKGGDPHAPREVIREAIHTLRGRRSTRTENEGDPRAPWEVIDSQLTHPGLGSSSLGAHILHHPLPPRKQLYNRYCSNKHTHTVQME